MEISVALFVTYPCDFRFREKNIVALMILLTQILVKTPKHAHVLIESNTCGSISISLS